MFDGLKRKAAFWVLLVNQVLALLALGCFVIEVMYLFKASMGLLVYAAIVILASLIDKLRKGF
ncbi:MAG TPA: hypothetical protein VFI02_14200 [Armatimonadota bacterium]|nr:hypothetical protein [Armatimonadota bacterium]